MAKHAGPRLPLVMKALVSTQSCVYEIQRVTSTAFLAEVGLGGGDMTISLVSWNGKVLGPRSGQSPLLQEVNS